MMKSCSKVLEQGSIEDILGGGWVLVLRGFAGSCAFWTDGGDVLGCGVGVGVEEDGLPFF